jgi:hypothetical protein
MRIPDIKGLIRRRILVNYRVDPSIIKSQLPPRFRPKLHNGSAIAGICLIRLEDIRPRLMPRFLGLSSENAAHRIAVTWDDEAGEREGVYIPRRDSASVFNRLAGGRLFPGEHHAARFEVAERDDSIDLKMESTDGLVRVDLSAEFASNLGPGTGFRSLSEASKFFENGSLGYSATRDASTLDGLVLGTDHWRVDPLLVQNVYSSYFADTSRFPAGSVCFDSALIMRNTQCEWHAAEDLKV